MPPPSPSSGVSHLKLQKRNGTYWLQADRRVTVDDKSSVNMLIGFSLVLMAPVQEGGAASSTDVAEFSDIAVAGKTSKESVSISPVRHFCNFTIGIWVFEDFLEFNNFENLTERQSKHFQFKHV